MGSNPAGSDEHSCRHCCRAGVWFSAALSATNRPLPLPAPPAPPPQVIAHHGREALCNMLEGIDPAYREQFEEVVPAVG